MAIYISLMKLTEKGIGDIKAGPARLQESVKTLESLGGKLLGFYLVMGEYDYVGIAEAPSDDVAMTFLLALGVGGNVRTTSMKAFTVEQFGGFLKKLP
jgi:uncharacterized protein with GYD domain